MAGAVGVLACAAPTLLAWNVAPSATFLNQALSLGLWGWFLVLSSALAAPARVALRHGWPVLLALLICVAATVAAWSPGALPASLALSIIGSLLAAAVVLLHGAALGAKDSARTAALTIFCIGWLAAGLLGAVVGALQVFWPELADGNWLAPSSIPGRAVGNLRQPNHLSSVLLWGCVAWVAMHELRGWRWPRSALLGVVLVVAVVLTASRTGLLSVLLLAAWGALDRRLSRPMRGMLLAAPVVYALAWWALSLWGEMSAHRFGGAERLAESDISGSRFGIWANTWTLVMQQPLTGVGMGEFNFAWSLTPFPGRPVAFFDHAHNLPLQLAAELGLPLAAVVMALLLLGLWRVATAAWPRRVSQPASRPADAKDTTGADLRADVGAAAGRAATHPLDAAGLSLRGACVMVLMIGLHSLLEYPLWYAYFLLPAAWIWGLALGVAGAEAARKRAPSSRATPASPRPSVALTVAGMALVAATVFALFDYQRVVVIFAAPEGAPPLAQRIADGQRSVLFAHHANYAAATTEQPLADPLQPFRSASHFLLDTRLMAAWAEALEKAGRRDQARHIAQRLREFRNPAAAEFFEPCLLEASTPKPFQCEAPQHALPPRGWREFAH